ncbi:MAG: ABC transporter substrate-binding protein [Coprococcus phoceensis]
MTRTKKKLKVVVGGDDCPDIFFSWCGEFTERFIREDLILDLTPYLEADQEWKDSLMESQMVNYTLDDGMVYGIPFRLDAKLFFYNIDQFEEAGVEVPTTFDELIEAHARNCRMQDLLQLLMVTRKNGRLPITLEQSTR